MEDIHQRLLSEVTHCVNLIRERKESIETIKNSLKHADKMTEDKMKLFLLQIKMFCDEIEECNKNVDILEDLLEKVEQDEYVHESWDDVFADVEY